MLKRMFSLGLDDRFHALVICAFFYCFFLGIPRACFLFCHDWFAVTFMDVYGFVECNTDFTDEASYDKRDDQ